MDASDIVGIPILSVEVAAGGGIEEQGEWVEGYFPMSRTYCRTRYGVPPESLRIVTITGRSMVPTLYPGDRVLMTLLSEDEQTPHDDMVFALFGPLPYGGAMVKRLRFEPGTLAVVSDATPDQPVWTGPFEDFRESYRLVARQLEIVGRAF